MKKVFAIAFLVLLLAGCSGVAGDQQTGPTVTVYKSPT
ncbi:MAG: lipoprotein [Anaerolineaceae bacterium]|jgi:PBP1b-binding outer membrane lipoprotein LpoB|nr:lipoprotein [Anaerolineaceae bacterium]